MSRKLVAYFSASGVTATAAEALAEAAGAELYRITPKVPYTEADLNWNDAHSRSSIEMNDLASRPALGGEAANIADVDVVFIGFPIWWYIAPTIINTFIESHDFSGKTIIPFATSGGSGLGAAAAKLKASAPESAIWKEGRLLNGKITVDAMKAWIEALGV